MTSVNGLETFPTYADQAEDLYPTIESLSQATSENYTRGFMPLETFPAKWYNSMIHALTKQAEQTKLVVDSIYAEIKNLIEDAGLTLTGTDLRQLKKGIATLQKLEIASATKLGGVLSSAADWAVSVNQSTGVMTVNTTSATTTAPGLVQLTSSGWGLSNANGTVRTVSASTTVAGITKLNSATNSSSETDAATPKAVKAAYDLANGKWTHASATAATDNAAGTRGTIQATAGSQTKYLRGDMTWQTPPNTTYSVFTGCTASAPGTQGLVPAPAAAQVGNYLSGGGTWISVVNTPTRSGDAIIVKNTMIPGGTYSYPSTFSEVQGHCAMPCLYLNDGTSQPWSIKIPNALADYESQTVGFSVPSRGNPTLHLYTTESGTISYTKASIVLTRAQHTVKNLPLMKLGFHYGGQGFSTYNGKELLVTMRYYVIDPPNRKVITVPDYAFGTIILCQLRRKVTGTSDAALTVQGISPSAASNDLYVGSIIIDGINNRILRVTSGSVDFTNSNTSEDRFVAIIV